MATGRKDQSKAGLPAKRRGQQTGSAGNPAKSREAKDETPATSGRRGSANKMFADKSSQHLMSDGATPRSNTPSAPAQTSGGHVGETGGEIAFKQRQAKSRKPKK
ncbi:MAG: hypothetical protein H7Y30_16360 [Pyrinomonadaceae bacterium]|nr:hypothetical protein [Pyrinomonadaceae bacterium]